MKNEKMKNENRNPLPLDHPGYNIYKPRRDENTFAIRTTRGLQSKVKIVVGESTIRIMEYVASENDFCSTVELDGLSPVETYLVKELLSTVEAMSYVGGRR